MGLKRIAKTSNYDRDSYQEVVINLPPMPHHRAEEICDILNGLAPSGEDFYKAVPIDYQPRKVEY